MTASRLYSLLSSFEVTGALRLGNALWRKRALFFVVGALGFAGGCREMAGKKKNKSPSAASADEKKSSASNGEAKEDEKAESKTEKAKGVVEPSGS